MKCQQCQSELVPSGCGCLNPKCHNSIEKWPKPGTMYSPPKDVKDVKQKKSKKKEEE